MERMFWGCKAQYIDISSFDISRNTYTDGMLAFCKAQIKGNRP